MTVEELSILMADIDYAREECYLADRVYDKGVDAMFKRVADILLRLGNIDEGEIKEFKELVKKYNK